MTFETWPPKPTNPSAPSGLVDRVSELESTLETLVLNQLEES